MHNQRAGLDLFGGGIDDSVPPSIRDSVPPVIDGPLRRGDSGAATEWLVRALDNTTDPTGPAWFGPDTETAVRRVQSAHGLVPDGIVGPETLFALTASNRDGPRLRRRW